MKSGVLIFIFLVLAIAANAAVSLPRLISDGMILQREHNLKIWGKASPNENVRVDFLNVSYKSITKSNGNWEVNIPPQKAGGPYQMKITGNNEIVINDILLGDVWICSGQSNMELPVSRVKVAYPDLISNSNNDKIRHFAVSTTYEFNEEKNDFLSGEWKKSNPVNVNQFSAVGYFFAKALYDKYKVPIGLIRIAVGGSPAEAWLPENVIRKYPHYNTLLEKYKNEQVVNEIITTDKTKTDNWNKNIDANDLGLAQNWTNNHHDFSNWENFKVPGLWKKNPFIENAKEQQVNISGTNQQSGVVWFKKEIFLSKAQLGRNNLLILGALVDRDEAYVNGELVGSTGYQYPPRRYNVANEFLKEGKNIITVRLVCNNANGGFVPDKTYALTLGNDTISLVGNWKYKVGYTSLAMPNGQVTFHYQPASLFNAMVSPLKNFAQKGVIWYQGESNTKNPKEYGLLMDDLITTWRTSFSNPTMPFLYVQLANFMEESEVPQESNWAELREVQRHTLKIQNTAMAVITDVGEWNDIHPLNKKTVGERLAFAAQKLAYGDKNVVFSGPSLVSYKQKKGKYVLKFKNTGSGLAVRNNSELKHFAIANKAGEFQWAKAEIKGENVIVWNTLIDKPTGLRYGWSHNPAKANLYNKEGLPASAFEVK